MGETGDAAGTRDGEIRPQQSSSQTSQPYFEHQEEILSLLLENASDVIGCYDREGQRLFGSSTLGEVLKRGAVPHPLTTATEYLLPHEACEEFREAMEESLASGERVSLDHSIQVRGKPYHFRTHFLPLGEEEGGAACVLAVTRDTTAVRENERIISLQRDLAVRMSELTDLDEALECVLRAALEASSLECGAIYLVEEPGGDLVMRAHRGLSGEFVRSAFRYGKETPQAALVHGAKVAVRDYRRTGYPLRESVRREGLRALAVVPLVRRGRVLGCINAASRLHDEVSPAALAALETIAGQMAGFMERLIVAEELRRTDQRIMALLENSSDMIAVTDEEGILKYLSPSFERIMGYSIEEVLGHSALEYIHPEDLQRCAEGLADLRGRPGQAIRQVMRFRDAQGNWRTLEGLLRNLVDEEIVGGYIINTRDITETVQAADMLRSSEERYRTIFQSTGTAMAIMEEDTAISLANLEMQRMLGLEGKEQGSERTLFVDMVVTEERDLFLSQVRTVAMGIQLQLKHFPLEVIGAGGRRTPTLATVAGLPRTGQTVISLIDVTMEKVYEQALEKHASDLRDFLSIASHELRHPITLIRGYASILREMAEEGAKAEDLAEHLQPIIESSVRLSHLAEELLEVSRIEQRRLVPAVRVQQLVPLVERAVEEITARMDWPVRLHGQAPDIRVEADGEGITRLLVILLENAVDFSPAGEPVEVRVGDLTGKARIEVMDRGPGISEEHRQRVFERFYQVEEVRHHSRSGLGLGLYIAKNIVEGHGGRIWCEPREGGGTIFTVELPAVS